MATVLGVDSSTRSTKVELRDADDGALLAAGSAPHPPTGSPRSEQDPTAWWDALVAAVRRARIDRVDAIAVAGQQHGLVALDADDRVIRPAKLWNDTESAAEAATLVDRLGPAAWAERTGSVPVAAFTVTKVAWLAVNEPAHSRRLAHLLLPHDYLTWRLSGRFTTDRGDASGTGYFSAPDGTWQPDLLNLADGSVSADEWRARLPEVVAPGDAVGPALGASLDELGLAGDVPVVVAPGTGDNMAAALGARLAPGDVAMSLGTSGTVYSVADRPAADASGLVAGFCDATGRYLPLVCVLNATEVTDTFARLLAVDQSRFAHLALGAPAGAGGLVLVPYLNGERTPNRPLDSGSLFGLRTGTQPNQIARAAHEGVVCGLLDGLDALDAAGVATTDGRLVVTGGGGRSPAYRQVVADVAGRPVTVLDADELVATGAAAQAAAVLRQVSVDEVLVRWTPPSTLDIEPAESNDGPAVRAAYAAARDRAVGGG
jgi:xylulokinase